MARNKMKKNSSKGSELIKSKLLNNNKYNINLKAGEL